MEVTWRSLMMEQGGEDSIQGLLWNTMMKYMQQDVLGNLSIVCVSASWDTLTGSKGTVRIAVTFIFSLVMALTEADVQRMLSCAASPQLVCVWTN